MGLGDLDYHTLARRLNEVKGPEHSQVYDAVVCSRLAQGFKSLYETLTGKELEVEQIPNALESLVNGDLRQTIEETVQKKE